LKAGQSIEIEYKARNAVGTSSSNGGFAGILQKLPDHGQDVPQLGPIGDLILETNSLSNAGSTGPNCKVTVRAVQVSATTGKSFAPAAITKKKKQQ
jgi:hypothetical protein